MQSTPRVTDQALLAALASDRDRLAAIDPNSLGAMVPGCPDWNVEQLLSHLGGVHRFAMRGLDTAPDGELRRDGREPGPPGEAVIGWVVDGLGKLIDTLAAGDGDAPCRGFGQPATRRFWLRRQAHETSIHRWDAESASSAPHAIDPEIAADGVQENLDVQPIRGYRAPDDVKGTIHLHATDGEGEWLLTLAEGVTWESGHHQGDAAVRGTREQLDLLLWNRIPPTRVELLGDTGLVERFLDSL